MKHLNKLFLVIILISLLVLALPGPVLAAGPNRSADDKVVLGGTYTLSSGDKLDGNLAVIGGSATIEKDAVVTGDAVLTGGTLDIDGEIQGNISAFGGSVNLNDNAVVHGNISLFGATLHKTPQAKVEGNTVNGSQGPLNFNIPQRNFAPWINLNPIWEFYGWLGRTLVMVFLAIIVVLVAPNPTNRTAQALVAQPALAGAYGLLTAVVAPIALILMLITILLIPVSLMGIVILGLAFAFGWVALGLEVGRRINRISKVEWAPAIQAGVGVFALSVLTGFFNLVPCVGWIVGAVIGLIGLGAVVLTRFGTRPYPPFGTASVAPYAPQPPVAPAAPYNPPTAYVAPVAPYPSSAVDVYPAPEPPRSAPDQPPAGPENI